MAEPAMESLQCATEDEKHKMPDILCSVYKWALGMGKAEKTVRSYIRILARLVEEDDKSPDAMATKEYFGLVKASDKNKSGNGQRAAAVKLFAEFWSQRAPTDPFEDSKGDKMFILHPPKAESGQPQPARSRARRAEAPQAGAAQAAAPSASTQAGDAQGAPVSASAAAAAALRDSGPPPGAPAAAAAAQGAAPGGPRLVPLADALRMLGVEDARRGALLFHGRRPQAANALRINGVYLREDQAHDGRPVWRKACSSKSTVICYAEALGMWRVTQSCDTKGEFAKVKDAAVQPWEVAKPWRVFVRESKEYLEDLDLRLCLLDPAALPQGLEVQAPEPSFCSTTAPPPSAARSPTVAASPGRRRWAAAALVSPDSGESRPPPGEVLRVHGRDPSAKNSERILGFYVKEAEAYNGRAHWKKANSEKPTAVFFNAEKGRWQISKDTDVVKGDFAHVKDSAASPWEATSAWKVFDGSRHVEDPSLRVEPVGPENLPDGAVLEATPRPRGAKRDRSPGRDAPEDPLEESLGPSAANADEATPATAAAGWPRPPPLPASRPTVRGRVAAKRAVRCKLRCACCFEECCRRAPLPC